MCIEVDHYHCQHFVMGCEIRCQKGIGMRGFFNRNTDRVVEGIDTRAPDSLRRKRKKKGPCEEIGRVTTHKRTDCPDCGGARWPKATRDRRSRSQPVEAGRAARSSKAVQTSRFTKSRKSVQASKLVKPNRSIESSRVFQPGRPVQSGNGGQPSDVVDDNELTDSHGELSNDEIDDVRGLPSPGPSQVNRESYGSVKQDSNEESVASDTTGRRLTQLITDIQPGSDELEDLYQKPSNEGNVAQNVPSRRSSQVSRVSRATSWRDSDQESIASNATSHRLSRLATDEGLSDGEEIVRDAPKRRRKVISKAHCSGAFFDSYEKIDAREMPKRRPSILRRVLHAGGRRSSDEEGVATAAMPRRRPSIIHKVTSSAYSMGSNLANLMHNNRSTDSSMESFTCIDASQQEARAAAAIPPRRPNRPLSTVSEGSRE